MTDTKPSVHKSMIDIVAKLGAATADELIYAVHDAAGNTFYVTGAKSRKQASDACVATTRMTAKEVTQIVMAEYQEDAKKQAELKSEVSGKK